MKCFQDRELHGQLLFLLPLTLVAVWVGFSLAPQAGYLALGLCALFGLTLVWSAWRRYRTMDALCQDLDLLLHGATGINLDMSICPFDEKALESMLAARSAAPAIRA